MTVDCLSGSFTINDTFIRRSVELALFAGSLIFLSTICDICELKLNQGQDDFNKSNTKWEIHLAPFALVAEVAGQSC